MCGWQSLRHENLIKYTEAGDPIKGDRAIIPFEAATINRIFTDYAIGISPKKIAGLLNAERIPGPLVKVGGRPRCAGTATAAQGS